MSTISSLQRRVTAEFLGTLFLVATVIGSGIMAERLARGDVALALLANAIATGAILVALIFTLASNNDSPKTIGQIIDHIEQIREELLALQRSMEKMESANPNGTLKKISK